MAEASEPLIQARGLAVRLGGRDVLHDVDLAVEPGAAVALIGPNGAGKTTLARTLLGLQRKHAGTLKRRKGLRVGYVPQQVAPDWSLPLTVGRFLALPRRQSRDAVVHALEDVGVAYAVDRPLQGLSGGEFQRVMLARALLRRPELLVLDEPLQGVDLGGELALFDLLRRLRHARGFALVVISHDLHLVMRGTDEVVCLNGHVCCRGTPEAVGEDPAYRHLFGDRAVQAAAVYAHHHDHSHAPDGHVVTQGEEAQP